MIVAVFWTNPRRAFLRFERKKTLSSLGQLPCCREAVFLKKLRHVISGNGGEKSSITGDSFWTEHYTDFFLCRDELGFTLWF